MKSYSKTKIVSLVALAMVVGFATNNHSEVGVTHKDGGLFETVIDSSAIGGRNYQDIKHLASLDSKVNVSKTYVQIAPNIVESTEEGEIVHNYMRFVTAIDMTNVDAIESIRYVREHDTLAEEVDEVTTVYKAVQADGEQYWYYDGNDLTNQENENNYYFAVYVIDFRGDTYKASDFKVSLEINGEVVAPYMEASFAALASNNYAVASFEVEGSLQGRYVVEKGQVPSFDGNTGSDFVCWSEGDTYYEEGLPAINENKTFTAVYTSDLQNVELEVEVNGATIDGLKEAYAYGETVQFTVSNNSHYRLISVMANRETLVAENGTYSFTAKINNTLVVETEQFEYEVRFYNQDEVTYTSVWYEEGETIELLTLDTRYHEGEPVTFTGWGSEDGSTLYTEGFEMGTKSVALYPKWKMPTLYNWSYDPVNDSYTSTGANGIRPFKGIQGAKYGELSADITLDITEGSDGNLVCNGLGLIWNADLVEKDYPTTSSSGNGSYMYMHINPRGGTTQIAHIDGVNYTSLPITRNSETYDTYWQGGELANWKTGTVSLNYKVIFTPSSVETYINDRLFTTYTGELCGTFEGTQVGIRGVGAGHKVENIEFTPYVYNEVTMSYVSIAGTPRTEKVLVKDGESLGKITVPGFEIENAYFDEDHTQLVPSNYVPSSDKIIYLTGTPKQNGFAVKNNVYTSILASSSDNAIIPAGYDSVGRYGKWSADFTNVETATSNSRGGLLICATVPTSDDTLLWNNSSINGIYLHHNPVANGNFTIAYMVNGVYTTKDSSGKGISKVSSSAAYKETDYYSRNAAWKAGETDSVTVNIAIERTKANKINVYVDGEVLISNFALPQYIIDIVDNNSACIGVGFLSGGKGTSFANFKFEPAE